MPGAGAMGIPPPAAQQAPGQLAAASAAAKANAKMVAKLWRSRARQQYFVVRGCFHVPKELNTAPLGLIFKTVAGVPAEVVRQLQTLSGWDVQELCPLAPAGTTPMTLPAELHFSTFISAVMAVLEYGMENAPPACISTVAELRHALEAVEKSMRTYLQFHAPDIAPYFRTSPRTACPRHEPWSR